MPSSSQTRRETSASPAGLDIASLRILRLALGTALSMWFSQIVNWPMSFIAPVFTMFILALPFPAPSFKGGIKFVVVLVVCAYAGLALLPFVLNQRWVGVLLLTLALFHSFYFTARGGSAVLGTFATVGLAIATSVGTVTIDGALQVVSGLTVGAVFGIAFVWIAHAILPDSSARAKPAQDAQDVAAPPKAPAPDLRDARRHAFRSLLIVMPIILWFLLSSASASYAALLIKVASMGQQASLDQTKDAGKSLLLSTLIGGAAAVIGWEVLSIWPSLIMYVLLIGLAALIMGPRIFAGQGMHPAAATWSYAFLTMIVILAPAVLDGQAGSSADAAFWSRFQMFIIATLYGVGAVFIFDALWPTRRDD
ncbi:MAG: DUF2955 domain-containing protein [Woeseiaceae bacterium]